MNPIKRPSKKDRKPINIPLNKSLKAIEKPRVTALLKKGRWEDSAPRARLERICSAVMRGVAMPVAVPRKTAHPLLRSP